MPPRLLPQERSDISSPRSAATLGEVARSAGGGTAVVADVALKENMGDAPACSNCGHMTVRNGSCYVCLTCGDTTGCS